MASMRRKRWNSRGKTLEPTGKNGGTHCKLIIAREGWAWGGGRRWGRVLRGRGGGGGAAGSPRGGGRNVYVARMQHLWECYFSNVRARHGRGCASARACEVSDNTPRTRGTGSRGGRCIVHIGTQCMLHNGGRHSVVFRVADVEGAL